MTTDVYGIGELPPIGEVPRQMHAQLVRPARFGEPRDAIVDEAIDVPELGPADALVMVMAAGVNFNNVWAARGVPVDVTKTQARWGERPGSTSWAPTPRASCTPSARRFTNVRVGDRVVVHAGQWDPDDPWVTGGGDGPRAQLPGVGYDSCWGSFAQFTKVQAHQCLPKGERLTWRRRRRQRSRARPRIGCCTAGRRTP